MSEADKMFEELGYDIKKPSFLFSACITEMYEKQFAKETKYIYFMKDNSVRCNFGITIEELKAINKKVEELRMELNIYQTYKVTITHTGATKTYEGFEDFKYTDSLEVNGGELMEWIAKRLLDNDISTFVVRHDGIKIEMFNPFTGEGGTIIYEIEEVINNAENKGTE